MFEKKYQSIRRATSTSRKNHKFMSHSSSLQFSLHVPLCPNCVPQLSTWDMIDRTSVLCSPMQKMICENKVSDFFDGHQQHNLTKSNPALDVVVGIPPEISHLIFTTKQPLLASSFQHRENIIWPAGLQTLFWLAPEPQHLSVTPRRQFKQRCCLSGFWQYRQHPK